MSSERERGDGGLGALAALGILVLAQLLLRAAVELFAAIAMLARGLAHHEAMRHVTTSALALGAAQLAGLSAAIAFGMRLRGDEQDARGQLSLEATPRAAVLLAFAGGLALQLPLVELTTLLVDLVPALAHDEATEALVREATRIDSPLRAVTVPFALVLVAPVTEELLFRGLLLPALGARYGTTPAVIATSVLFGLFHLDAQAAFFATAMGLVLGVVRVRSGSVLPAIALHAGFNALPVILKEEICPIDGFNVTGTEHVPAWIVVLSLALATASLGGLHAVLERRRA